MRKINYQEVCKRSVELSRKTFNYLSSTFKHILEKFLQEYEFDRDLKLYPLVCGSLVEGLLIVKSDVDFAFLLEGTFSTKDISTIKSLLSNFLKEAESTLKEKFNLKGFCYFSRFIRFTSMLTAQSKTRRASFRLFFYTFSKALNTPPYRIIASEEDVKRFKLALINSSDSPLHGS